MALYGAGGGFAGGLGVAVAEVATGSAPVGWGMVTYCLSGATAVMFFWWIGNPIVAGIDRKK